MSDMRESRLRRVPTSFDEIDSTYVDAKIAEAHALRSEAVRAMFAALFAFIRRPANGPAEPPLRRPAAG